MKSTRGGAALKPRSRSANALLLALLMVLPAACGDATYDVEVHNATDVPIILVMTGVTRGELPELPEGPPRYGFQPGESRDFLWWGPFGSKSPATVRAEDPSGTLIFCRRFTYAEIQQVSFRIEIVRGDIRCGG
jgi:hypothetical protein